MHIFRLSEYYVGSDDNPVTRIRYKFIVQQERTNFVCSPRTPTASSKSSCLLPASVVDASVSEKLTRVISLLALLLTCENHLRLFFQTYDALSQALFFPDVLGICSSWTSVEKGPRLKLWVRPCPRLLYVCCLLIDYDIASFYLELV